MLSINIAQMVPDSRPELKRQLFIQKLNVHALTLPIAISN